MDARHGVLIHELNSSKVAVCSTPWNWNLICIVTVGWTMVLLLQDGLVLSTARRRPGLHGTGNTKWLFGGHIDNATILPDEDFITVIQGDDGTMCIQ